MNSQTFTNVTLTIADIVEAPQFFNTYELVVGYEHGDADGSTEKRFYYSDDPVHSPSTVEDLKNAIIAIEKLNNLYEPREIFDTDNLVKFFTYRNYAAPEDAADDFSDTFYEGDITCEGEAASMGIAEIIYYDERGIPHYVNYKVE